MPRKPREFVEGGIYHVYARGNNRQRIYRDEFDCALYLRMLGDVVERNAWLCLSYCLMRNHVHLLVQTPKGDLCRGMQLLHGQYVAKYNKRHRRGGHLFQGRYGATLIASDEQFHAAARYIAQNPVRAGLCQRPEQWRWSAYAATLGAGSRPSWLAVNVLLEHFGAAGGDARKRYEDAIDGGTAARR
jgi:REP-associated tyrosine transposase